MLGTIYDRKSGETKEFEEIKDYLDKYNYTFFNYEKHEDMPDILNNPHNSYYDKNGIANYLYDPQDIPDDYEPVIRGYLKQSEDWELKQYNFAHALIGLRKLEADELYFDFKKTCKDKDRNKSTNIKKLFQDLKTGDTLVVLNACDLVYSTYQFTLLIEYLKHNKICFIIGNIKADFRKNTSAIEKGMIEITGVNQISERDFYHYLIDKPTNPKEIREQEEWRAKQLAEYEKLKKSGKIKE